MKPKLLTVAEIAKELQIPESTVRYYRDRFLDYIPYVGEGRAKRYRLETLDVLRFIAEGFNRKLTATEIEEGLSRMVARNIDVEETTAMTAAAVQQQSHFSMSPQVMEEIRNIMGQFTQAMNVIADQKEEIAELRKVVVVLKEQQEQQKQYIESSLNEQNEKFMAAIQSIQEEREAASKKKTWWRRLFEEKG